MVRCISLSFFSWSTSRAWSQYTTTVGVSPSFQQGAKLQSKNHHTRGLCGCLTTHSRFPSAVFSTALSKDTRSPVQTSCTTCYLSEEVARTVRENDGCGTNCAKIIPLAASAARQPLPNPFRSYVHQTDSHQTRKGPVFAPVHTPQFRPSARRRSCSAGCSGTVGGCHGRDATMTAHSLQWPQGLPDMVNFVLYVFCHNLKM